MLLLAAQRGTLSTPLPEAHSTKRQISLAAVEGFRNFNPDFSIRRAEVWQKFAYNCFIVKHNKSIFRMRLWLSLTVTYRGRLKRHPAHSYSAKVSA